MNNDTPHELEQNIGSNPDTEKDSNLQTTNKSGEIRINISKLLKKINWEVLFILIFLGFLLNGISIFNGGQLSHETPYQFVAGDMFWLLNEAENIKDSEFIFDRQAEYTNSKKLFNSFPFFQPLYIAQISYITGLKTHDALFHGNLFLMIFNVLLTYLLFRKINKNLATLSIPLSLFVFTWPFTFNITWGMQMSNMNFFMALIGLLVFTELEKKKMFIILGIINTAGIFSHVRETIIFNLGILLYFVITILRNKFSKQIFKKYIYSILVTCLIMFYFLPILHGYYGGYGSSTILKYCPGNPDSIHYLSLDNLSWFKYPIYLGLILSVFSIFTIKNKNQLKILAFAYVLLFARNFCFIGNKYTQIAHFTYLISIIFAGIFFVNIAKIAKIKNKKIIYVLGVVLLILVLYLIPIQTTPPSYAVSNPETWNAFEWIHPNLKKDATILFVYGDNFYQSTLFYGSKRRMDYIEPREFYATIQKNQLTPEFKISKGVLGPLLNRTGFFTIEKHTAEMLINGTICDYNYAYYNKVSREPIVQQYVGEINKILTEELNFQLVFENQLVQILKNPNPGGDCFETRQFIQTN